MRIRVSLPRDRYTGGSLVLLDDNDSPLFGPIRCRGEADNKNAAQSDNVIEDPTRVGGDHPYGDYKVTKVIRIEPPDDKYGPYFIALEPLRGEALEAKNNGRSGIGLHGGRLHPDGRLRETFGCNRIDDGNLSVIAPMVHQALNRSEEVPYECVPA